MKSGKSFERWRLRLSAALQARREDTSESSAPVEWIDRIEASLTRER
jgi:hypothetical protein